MLYYKEKGGIDMENEKKKSEELTENISSNNENKEKRTNADNLHTVACIYVLLSIISAIIVWTKFSIVERTYADAINWFAILGGIAILFIGATIYFLFETIVDIYEKVEK
jgi:hypothetical protein